jgi:acetyl-CoA carboxylase alpha subunit
MAGLKTPIITLVIGEGGSGGALAIAMGDKIGMLQNAYYGVISPEGAASILGRYKDEADKAEKFPADCRTLAATQGVFAKNLLSLKVIDEVIAEDSAEDYENFPNLQARVYRFVDNALSEVTAMSLPELRKNRYALEPAQFHRPPVCQRRILQVSQHGPSCQAAGCCGSGFARPCLRQRQVNPRSRRPRSYG